MVGRVLPLRFVFRGKVAGFLPRRHSYIKTLAKHDWMAEDIEERTMELTIEALTGTVYDLCVSPYETILGIKMKVQRLEGENIWQGCGVDDQFPPYLRS